MSADGTAYPGEEETPKVGGFGTIPIQLPEKTTVHHDGPDKSSTSTLTAPQLSPIQVETAKNRDKITQGEKAIADKEYQAGVAMDAAKAAADADKATATENALTQSQGDIDQWTQRLRTARERYDAVPLPSLFGDKSTGGKVLMGLGLALGALGSAASAQANARLGGNGTAPDTVGEIIKADLDRQRQNIQLLSDREAMAKAGLNDAYAARKLLLADVDLRGSLAYQKVANLVKTRLSAQGLGPREIEKNQAYLDADKGAQEQQEKVVAGLTQTKTNTNATHTIADVETKNENKPSSETNKIPSIITDQLSGSDLPVDPSRTDQRKHNTATAKVAPINTIIETGEGILKATENGPQSPEWQGYFGKDVDAQAKLAADVARFRSAYATSKSESMGQHNAEELAAKAIPDPPSDMNIGDARWNAWKTKMNSAVQEMYDLRGNELANAGVPPAAIAASRSAWWKSQHPEEAAKEAKKVEASPAAPDWPRHVEPHIPGKAKREPSTEPDDANAPDSSRPLEEDPSAPSIDSLQRGAKVPAVRNVDPVVRQQAIEFLKASPARRETIRGKRAMQQFNITDEDLK